MLIKYKTERKTGLRFPGFEKVVEEKSFKLNTGAITFKTIILLIAMFCLYFAINNYRDFYANNGDIVNREYNRPAVTVENGEVLISTREFESYRRLDMGSDFRFFSTIEVIDSMAKGFNYESSSLSFDMWLAKNIPLLANWKDGTFDGEGWFAGIERFLNLIQGLLYTLCTGIFRFIYYIFYKCKFFFDILDLLWI